MIDIGVDWIEMDVQRTKDGVLLVLHDQTVDRTTNGKGKVGEMNLNDPQPKQTELFYPMS